MEETDFVYLRLESHRKSWTTLMEMTIYTI